MALFFIMEIDVNVYLLNCKVIRCPVT